METMLKTMSTNQDTIDASEAPGPPPVEGATWVRPYERSTGHVRGYWLTRDGERIDEVEINAPNDAILPASTLSKKNSKRASASRVDASNAITAVKPIDIADVDGIIAKGEAIENEIIENMSFRDRLLAFTPQADGYIDESMRASAIAAGMTKWISKHGGNGGPARDATGRYADDLNVAVSPLPDSIKQMVPPVMVDSVQGSGVEHRMTVGMGGYYYHGRISTPANPIDMDMDQVKGELGRDMASSLENVDAGTVVVNWSSCVSAEDLETGSTGTTALMKTGDGTARKIVIGKKFSLGRGSSLRKISNDATMVISGHDDPPVHVSAPVYEVRERGDTYGSAIIMKTPKGNWARREPSFQSDLLHEYTHHVTHSHPGIMSAFDAAYEEFDGGVNENKQMLGMSAHHGFGNAEYMSVNPDEFASESTTMLFHPAGLNHLGGSDDDTVKIRRWVMGFWGGIADGSIKPIMFGSYKV